MQRLIDHASANPGPLICILGTEDYEVDRDAKIAKSLTEPHELRSATLQPRLYNEQIQVAVRTALAARTGAEQDHLGVGRGCGQTTGSLCD